MKTIYLFDVDGTLTPAKEKANPKFAKAFLEWMQSKEVYIVSGGSFDRIINQVGVDIVRASSGVFACMGNIFLQEIEFVNETGYSEWGVVYENTFKIPDQDTERFQDVLDGIVSSSEYPVKTGNHYEERVGMVNFSIVGRNATQAQRKAYAKYDAEHLERHAIVERLKEEYPKLDFVIGGAVSIDIFNIGNDKSQIVERYFNEAIEGNKIVFVGDRIPFPGNDYALATALCQHPNGSAYEVESWRDTEKLLKKAPFV